MKPFTRLLYDGKVELRYDGWYNVRDFEAGTTQVVPSVSRVLSNFNQNFNTSDVLARWALRRGVRWLERELKPGFQRLSAHRIADLYRGLTASYEAACESAQARGAAIRDYEAACESERARGAAIHDWMKEWAEWQNFRRRPFGFPQAIRPVVFRFMKWAFLNCLLYVPEWPVVSMRHGYAGCIDLMTSSPNLVMGRREPDDPRLLHRSAAWVIKTAPRLLPDHVLQVTAYAMAYHEEHSHLPCPTRGILLFPKAKTDRDMFIPYLLDDDEFDEDAEAFLGRLKVTECTAALNRRLRIKREEYEMRRPGFFENLLRRPRIERKGDEMQRKSGPWDKANPEATKTSRTLRRSAATRSEGKENGKC